MPEYETETVSTYSKKITFQKYLIELVILLIITGLTWVIDYLIPNISLDYPEYAGILLIAAPLIEALRNWLKHRHDTKTVKIDPATGIIINNS